MRQSRIKKDSDPSQQSPEGDILTSSQYITVSQVKIERQCSEPSPNFLTVPTPTTLVKQHSHPLLPSQIHQSFSETGPHHHSFSSSQFSPFPDTERAISPMVIVSDPLCTEASVPVPNLPTLRVRTEELRRTASSPTTGSSRSSHCPAVRPGPALGCNFCWNTIDKHGRILRRKTKYHCPECETNLCIVPCFQEYHEKQANSGTDPSQLTSAIQRVFPKTSSI